MINKHRPSYKAIRNLIQKSHFNEISARFNDFNTSSIVSATARYLADIFKTKIHIWYTENKVSLGKILILKSWFIPESEHKKAIIAFAESRTFANPHMSYFDHLLEKEIAKTPLPDEEYKKFFGEYLKN